jgi:phage-related protein
MAAASLPDLPLVWLHGEIKTPPFSLAARIEAGELLRRLQRRESLAMPHARAMPGIGRRCHELRIQDERIRWRIVYRADHDAIIVLAVFRKTTRETPQSIMDVCRKRLAAYDRCIEDN